MMGVQGRSAFAQAPPAERGPAPRPVAADPAADRLTQAQLEQLLAPVALYPDQLLTQMLMPDYPLGNRAAKRWRDRQPSLRRRRLSNRRC